MNVSSTAPSFQAEKKAMAAARAGGSRIAPSAAARAVRRQAHASRRNAAAAQLAPIASTVAGPTNTSSSSSV
jgi:hypothetical protein